ncbi:nucleotide sugar dehydrogenase [Pseudarthrobacter chlorophenolicus A6]|uniref:Nucleotide sugar dehydrogenase n=1 Tax=Pseudarthrobacter chlorophenolicus (strain ATCC 700700 / DSM 12829 / CIP 107037 / JCM 12360 / KCTC 9906 / NCIMB 13794 / A6) TaxID=452863 RepID=B8H6I9_PSECP|nr:nucleotide sugar dehydrogenase [Pseudarthrobacter chlorophenolicus]ACL41515.1 nucleotide sugar dehydrogenase [Pseudarthrobacter chlorophenolicus A6]SDQ62815.1 nucleotide sugar dehydrogenase [Pseudarthrobacter chlorophenolicus]
MAPNTKVKTLKKQVAVESHSLPAEAVEWTEGTAARAIPAQDQVFTFDVAIVGLGYVGLPTALAINASGRRVLGLDVSERRLAVIREQQADLLDSDKERLKTALLDPSFMLTSDLSLLAHAAAVVVCVPTPVDEYLVPDLGILRAACASVVEYAVPGQLLMLTSTTYVGTTRDLLAMPLAAKGLIPGRDVYVAFSPERINPGVDSFSHEDVPRVVGGVTAACGEAAERLLSASTKLVHVVPSADAAEMTKLVENTFRAVNIALANEFAQICHELDMEVMDVINAAATKPYGFMPFTPGPGVGGHCIPCDPHYLLWQLRKARVTAPVIEQAMIGIAGRPHQVVEKARRILSERNHGLAGARVMVVGVAYKPDVEDLRESPALEIIAELIADGAEVAYSDPWCLTAPDGRGGTLISNPAPQLWEADLVILHTRHSQTDLDWLENATAVLDTTYRLPKADNVTRL